MSTGDPTIETARISARQAIVVALITGIVSIVTTLFTTGTFSQRRNEGTAASSGSTATAAPVMNAPHLFYNARTIDSTLDECMKKARGALDRGKFTGVSSKQHFSWGYRDENIGAIWCHTDARQVIFLAAGKDESAVEATRMILERSY